jgi:hypothetical protein
MALVRRLLAAAFRPVSFPLPTAIPIAFSCASSICGGASFCVEVGVFRVRDYRRWLGEFIDLREKCAGICVRHAYARAMLDELVLREEAVCIGVSDLPARVCAPIPA